MSNLETKITSEKSKKIITRGVSVSEAVTKMKILTSVEWSLARYKRCKKWAEDLNYYSTFGRYKPR